MKIGIIGLGVVGGAIFDGLTLINNNNISLIGYDKYKDSSSFEEVLNTSIVFICVPTQFSEKTNEYNKDELHNVLQLLKDSFYSGLIVIKCTVEPLISEELAKQYDLKIIHNPEFLTANRNVDDFVNQNHIVLGKTSKINEEDLNIIVKFYSDLFPDVQQSICTSTESECMKIFVNNFYSVKIQFFNELFLLCNKIGINYDHVKNMMLKNGWINPMHTQVPGTDGKLSYGGMCFPKDTNALLEFMKKQDTNRSVLEACVNERNSMRSDNINIQQK